MDYYILVLLLQGNNMLKSLSQYGESTFSSLRVRNYRLYYIGQIISNTGTIMQSVAQAWLVLQLTQSGTALGLVTALQYLPILFLSPFGGVIADRFPKRTLLIITQTIFGIQALILGILVATNTVQLWHVEVLALVYGLVNTLDNPTRQSFVVELVGESQLRNAVTLYSSLFNMSRIIGSSVAGLLIAGIGLAPCFILNAISYIAVLIMLFMMRSSEFYAAPVVSHVKGLIREGFQYVISTPVLRNVLLMMALIGTLTFEFQVTLPLVAQFAFQGGAESYAALSAAMGVGAVTGGLIVASQKKVSLRYLIAGALLFGVAVLIAALMPNLILAVLAMVLVGMASINFTSLGNTVIQLESKPQMRGRVMAFWSITFLGSTTIGGPLVGWIGEHVDARWGLATGAIAALVAAAWGYATLRNEPLRSQEPRTSPASK